MVIVILGILTAVAMRSLTGGLEASRAEATIQEMNLLVEAITGNPNLYANGVRTDFGYVGDVGALPPNLDALVTNPGFGTWRGPYIQSQFSNYSDDYKRDAWGALYAYTGTIIRSAGGTDTLTRVLTSATTDLLNNSVSGVLTDAAGNPPGDSATNLLVIISFPNGSGGIKDSAVVPNSSGVFTFSSCVPIGNHKLRAVHFSTTDTVQTFVCVFPKSTVQASLRFPGALWAASGGGGGGGGGSSSSIEYVAGTATVFGAQNQHVSLQIINLGTVVAVVSHLTLTYGVTAYIGQIRWGSTTVFNASNPRPGSGQQINLSLVQTLNAGQSAALELRDFRAMPNGGARVNMRGQNITISFSDGSSFSFTTP